MTHPLEDAIERARKRVATMEKLQATRRAELDEYREKVFKDRNYANGVVFKIDVNEGRRSHFRAMLSQATKQLNIATQQLADAEAAYAARQTPESVQARARAIDLTGTAWFAQLLNTARSMHEKLESLRVVMDDAALDPNRVDAAEQALIAAEESIRNAQEQFRSVLGSPLHVDILLGPKNA